MNNKLEKETAFKNIRDIFDKKVLVVVGTGASMSVDPRFGMASLTDELRRKIPDVISSSKDLKKIWEEIEEKINKTGLEKALDGVDNQDMISIIIKITGDFVAGIDAEYKKKRLLDDSFVFPMEKFLQKLYSVLSKRNPFLNIITPNYDLLIEHICDKNKIPCWTGFAGGIIKNYDWNMAEQEMCYPKKSRPKGKIIKVEGRKLYIKLHKVHGSLNWFWRNEQIIEENSLTYNQECGLKRAIITPGDAKIPEAFMNFRDLFSRADNAIAGDDAFIFVGYGFNDIHIEKEIDLHLKTNDKLGIIITKKLSDKAEDLIKSSKNLWAVFQDTDNEANTLIQNNKYETPLIIENSGLWQINEFTDTILGA